MPYRSAKVYNDGSHYIAIPQTNNSTKRKKNPTKTVCTGKKLQTAKNKTDKRLRSFSLPRKDLRKFTEKITAKEKPKR